MDRKVCRKRFDCSAIAAAARTCRWLATFSLVNVEFGIKSSIFLARPLRIAHLSIVQADKLWHVARNALNPDIEQEPCVMMVADILSMPQLLHSFHELLMHLLVPDYPLLLSGPCIIAVSPLHIPLADSERLGACRQGRSSCSFGDAPEIVCRPTSLRFLSDLLVSSEPSSPD